MNAQIAEVFNTYNVNILFTVAALPARVSLGLPMSAPGGLLSGAPTSSGAPSQNQQQLGYGGPQIQYQQQVPPNGAGGGMVSQQQAMTAQLAPRQ